MRTGSIQHRLYALGMAWLCVVAGAVLAASQQPESAHTLIRPERIFDAATGEVRTGWGVLVAERTLLSGFTLVRDLGSEGAGWAEISSLDSPSVAGASITTTQLTERTQ